eukprot:scaffold40377_cov168-Amphora_coffeaeformis.AAC.5
MAAPELPAAAPRNKRPASKPTPAVMTATPTVAPAAAANLYCARKYSFSSAATEVGGECALLFVSTSTTCGIRGTSSASCRCCRASKALLIFSCRR